MPTELPPKTVNVGSIRFANNRPMVLMAGPCVIESLQLVLGVASSLKTICRSLQIPFIFKSSYDKANRSSSRSYRGPGLEEGLKALAAVKKKLKVPILTDVHTPQEAEIAAEVADVLQIPAFLCRQTDLLVTAARTGRVINVKKGQFLAPWDMKNVIAKLEDAGTDQILITERGTTFGYNNLVVDMRGLSVMKSFGYPVIYDATHSVQLPGGQGDQSGGQSEFIWPLARAAAGLGVAGFFMEVHPTPEKALSDGPNSAPLKDVKPRLSFLKEIDSLVKKEGRRA